MAQYPELEVDTDQFEDFDSDDLDLNASDENDDYLSGMWSGYGFRQAARSAQDIVVAHGMVQSFVNAFARDGEYVVRFSENASTAGTDMKGRVVHITTAPILDDTITAQEASLVLTGLAVHEICHPRYGKNTFAAAAQAFRRSRVAKVLSNLLDDVRIERRFVADYPGYAGVFEPLLKYISGDPVPKLADQLNLAIASVRFEKWSDWTDPDPRVAQEREWWKQWAAHYAREDSPRRHVDGIRVALKHMVDLAEQLRSEAAQDTDETGTAQNDESEDTGTRQDSPEDAQDGQGDAEADEDGNDAPGADEGPEGPESDDPFDQSFRSEGELDGEILGSGDDTPEADQKTDAEDAERDSDAEDSSSVPSASDDLELGSSADEVDFDFKAGTNDDLVPCPSGTEVEDAARESGVSQEDIDAATEEADQIVRDAAELQDGVDVATHYRGLTTGTYSRGVRRSGPASRFVRDALMRARTGHTRVSHYQRSGQLDNYGLIRVAHQDFRVFQRRHAPGPEKLLIWVMIDCSGSMGSASADAATVATAIANATQHVRTTRMAVWGWSDSFRRSDYMPGVCRVWQTGQPTSDIAKIADLPQRGTPDSTVLNWAWRAILREVRNGERPVILFASDGGGYGDLKMKVDEARGHGVDVYSVAIGSYVNRDYQQQVYGEGNFVEWQGSIIKTARPLAGLVARMVAGRGR